MKTRIPVDRGNVRAALQEFFVRLLQAGVVDALFVPMTTSTGAVTPALVSDPALLSAADPLAPVLPVNGATLVGKLSVREPRPKLGIVLRSCELRALIELVKLQQASLADLTLIALDCPGTFSVPVYYQKLAGGETGEAMWRKLIMPAVDSSAKQPIEIRSACQVCEKPFFDGAAIAIEFFGSDLDQEIGLTLDDSLAEKLGLEQAGENQRRVEAVEALIAARTARRDAEFAAIRSRLAGSSGSPNGERQGLNEIFATCIRCHNCMTVCPICYCKTCVFKSAIFDHDPMQMVQWSRQKGAYRMPGDTSLFHLTRLNHMSLSCVGCGMCTEACPAELPVGMVFRAIGQNVQNTFGYTAGRSIEEPLPLITFKADEWTDVGE